MTNANKKIIRKLVKAQGAHIGAIKFQIEKLGIDFKTYEAFIELELMKKRDRVVCGIKKKRKIPVI